MSTAKAKAKPKPPGAYGLDWDSNDPLAAEMFMIRNGGSWKGPDGKTYGKGLFWHYRELQKLLWPEDDHHKWSDLILKTILEERISVILGARDSSKTHSMAKYALTDYFVFPEDTLILMSSTDIQGLEMRVWGQIKDLWRRAKARYPFMPGNVIDAKRGIFTDNLMDDELSDLARDMRRGIICVAIVSKQGQDTGCMSKFVGIKQKRRRLIADETQFLSCSYLDTLSNLDSGDFKGVYAGNPIGGNGKALDKISEPEGGWNSIGEVTKTKTWRNKFDGVTVNLVGTDSPNFDDPTQPNRYPYMIKPSDAAKVKKRNGEDSVQYWSQIMGVRKIGVDAHRVMTVAMIEHAGGNLPVFWGCEGLTKIYGIDAGYGGDECRAEYLEFGKDAGGQMVIKFHPTTLIPVTVSGPVTPEDQIALFAKDDCERLGVPTENVFFEAGMRATLAISFARIMGSAVNAINFGGQATERPVNNDLFVYDEHTKQRRLKRSNEHYSKFVTELWFAVREIVESHQAREFPTDIAEEFQMREWRWVPGSMGERYELETKLECKQRMGSSPNAADCCAISCEGARRRGFIVARMEASDLPPKERDWLDIEVEKHRKFMREHELNYYA